MFMRHKFLQISYKNIKLKSLTFLGAKLPGASLKQCSSITNANISGA